MPVEKAQTPKRLSRHARPQNKLGDLLTVGPTILMFLWVIFLVWLNTYSGALGQTTLMILVTIWIVFPFSIFLMLVAATSYVAALLNIFGSNPSKKGLFKNCARVAVSLIYLFYIVNLLHIISNAMLIGIIAVTSFFAFAVRLSPE